MQFLNHDSLLNYIKELQQFQDVVVQRSIQLMEVEDQTVPVENLDLKNPQILYSTEEKKIQLTFYSKYSLKYYNAVIDFDLLLLNDQEWYDFIHELKEKKWQSSIQFKKN